MPPSPGGTPPRVASASSRMSTSGRLMRAAGRSEEHTSELQSQSNLVCRLLLEKKKNKEIAIEGEIQPEIHAPEIEATLTQNDKTMRRPLLQRDASAGSNAVLRTRTVEKVSRNR